ncbi:MAG: phosphoglycerate dehydrogenase [Oscillospiraceae bacterium]|nr:phosphoglycerate dehydrogenase [Oscillospiraceae bacterium]
MAKKVLIAKPFYQKFSPTGYRMLQEKGYEIVSTELDRDYFLDELIPLVGDIDGCIANCEPWGEEALSAAPKLKILARYGTGMNSVDTEAVRRHGVMCTNCPGINANPVAEHVMAMLLGALRDLPNLSDSTKKGLWKTGIFRELTGATVGIVGFGFIGQLVAKKLMGFDCRVLAYDIAPNQEAAEKTGVTFTGFEELLAHSDFIILLVPLVPDTFEMINSETLRITKPGAVFVSDARGEVVDEAAMYEALVSGQVSYFATDVFVHEPATPENTPLLTLPNVIATPHNGAETYENGERCGILTAQQIIDALEGREPAHRQV